MVVIAGSASSPDLMGLSRETSTLSLLDLMVAQLRVCDVSDLGAGELERVAVRIRRLQGAVAALKAIYSSCGWFGCDRPVGWCEAHHVVFWEHLGPTDLANLVPLCSRHHHLVHEGGWRLELTGNRALRHFRPDGELWRTSHPDRGASSGDGARRPATGASAASSPARRTPLGAVSGTGGQVDAGGLVPPVSGTGGQVTPSKMKAPGDAETVAA